MGVGLRFLSRVKTTILGSREQQCCNPELKNTHGSNKNNACLKLVKSKRCQLYDLFSNSLFLTLLGMDGWMSTTTPLRSIPTLRG